jgi:hypothetical protein
MQTITGSISWVHRVVFSSDSTRLASASVHYGKVQIWNISSGDCLQTLLLDDSRNIQAGAFSNDLNKLASISSTDTWPHQTSSSSFTSGSLSPQRESNFSIEVWDMVNGTCLQAIDGQNKPARSIFDANSGVCLQTLSVDRRITSLSFDSTGSYLHTDVGTIDIDSSETSSLVDLAEPKQCQWLGVGVGSNGMWITKGDQNILRIPPEYRANCSSVGGNMVAIGTGSGKVWICSVDLPGTPICR